jgi:hypothetical protein
MNDFDHSPSSDPDRIVALSELPRHQLPDHVLDAMHARIDELGDAVIMRINRWAMSIAAAILIVCSLMLVRELSPVQTAASAEPLIDSVALMSTETAANTPAETRLAQWIVSELHEQAVQTPPTRENAHD